MIVQTIHYRGGVIVIRKDGRHYDVSIQIAQGTTALMKSENGFTRSHARYWGQEEIDLFLTQMETA